MKLVHATCMTAEVRGRNVKVPRLKPIDRFSAGPETRALLDRVEQRLGMVPNMIATMAQSPAVANAYLSFAEALSDSLLSPTLGEQLALAIGQANACRYCLTARAAIGRAVGLSDDELRDARRATSPDRKTETALRFAMRILDRRGRVSDDDVAAVREAGYGETEIAEIVAHVALNLFTNYFNHVAQTDVDYPPLADVVEP